MSSAAQPASLQSPSQIPHLLLGCCSSQINMREVRERSKTRMGGGVGQYMIDLRSEVVRNPNSCHLYLGNQERLKQVSKASEIARS